MRTEERLTTKDWDRVVYMRDVDLLSFLEIGQAFGGSYQNGYFTKGYRRRKNQLPAPKKKGDSHGKQSTVLYRCWS
jgi:hypothetical protein